jgi:hypothetical protein
LHNPRLRKEIIGAVLLAGVVALSAAHAAAQAVRAGPVKPKPADPVSSLSISVTPSSVSFQLVSEGVAAGSVPVGI